MLQFIVIPGNSYIFDTFFRTLKKYKQQPKYIINTFSNILDISSLESGNI